MEEMDEKESILIVDDDESICRSLRLIFEKKGYETETAGTGREAIEKAQGRVFNVALLDIRLPDMDGIELPVPLKEMHPDMAVILLTGYASLETAVRALNEGASAYITKPLNMDEVLATVREALEKQRLVMEKRRAEEALQESEERLRAIFEGAQDAIFTKDLEGRYTHVNAACASLFGLTVDEMRGKTDFDLFPPEVARHTQEIDRALMGKGEAVSIEETKPIADVMRTFHVSKVPLRDASGKVVGLCGIACDITERKRAEEQLVYMATHDPLTGLPNRALFNDRLTLALAHAHRNQQKLAVMLLDLDLFKDVNDTLGHSMGDKLLEVVGDRLTSLLRKSDTVARMGGDEFLLLLPEMARGEDAAKIAQKFLEAFRKPFEFDGYELYITTSIGIAIYPYDGEDADSLMKNADIAMYRAKERGRDNYQRYSGKGGRDGREREHPDR